MLFRFVRPLTSSKAVGLFKEYIENRLAQIQKLRNASVATDWLEHEGDLREFFFDVADKILLQDLYVDDANFAVTLSQSLHYLKIRKARNEVLCFPEKPDFEIPKDMRLWEESIIKRGASEVQERVVALCILALNFCVI